MRVSPLNTGDRKSITVKRQEKKIKIKNVLLKAKKKHKMCINLKHGIACATGISNLQILEWYWLPEGICITACKLHLGQQFQKTNSVYNLFD